MGDGSSRDVLVVVKCIPSVEMDEPVNKKRLCSYNRDWELKRSWVKATTDPRRAFCNLCRKEISIGHGGEHDLSRHEEAECHKKAVLAKGASNISFIAG